MLSAKKSVFKRILITVIIAILVFSIISLAATKFIYDGIFARVDSPEIKIPTELTDMVSNRQEQQYYSEQTRLTGYLYACDNPNNKNSLIVLAPGFNAGADSYLWQISELVDLGWSVFAFDPSGCYSSSGESSVGFAQEVLDLSATLFYIEKNNRFGYNDIALLGHSRGGYAACCVLAEDYDISAVISISGVNSAMEGVLSTSSNYIGNLAYTNYGFLWLYQAILFGTETLNLKANEEIAKSKVPVLIVHGEKDNKVPLNKYSIISYKDEIDSKNVEYYICCEKDKNGHTNLLFDEDGSANNLLITQINEFLIRSIN